MKKIIRVLCSLIFVFMVGVGCGCNGCSSKIYPVSIQEWDLPKTTYELGEHLDLTGSTITVELSNQETESYEVTYDMVSVYDLLNVYGSVGEHKLQVNYEQNGHKVTFVKTITITISADKLAAVNEIKDYKAGTASIYSEDAQARIDALKVLSRSAIYSSNDAAEVDEIKAKALAAIDTVLTAAEEELNGSIAAELEAKLNKKIQDVSDQVTTLGNNITAALANYVSQEAANQMKDAITAEYTQAIADAIAAIPGGGGQGPQGEPGPAGQDGKKLELTVANNKIMYRYEGDANWTDLYDMSTLVGPKGDPGAAGAPGAQGEKGVGIQSVALSNAGVLTITFTDNTSTDLDLAATFATYAGLNDRLTTLEGQLANELDPNVADSIQNQIDTLADTLEQLSQEVDGLNISDTFDALKDRLDAIEAYFANSGVDAADISATSLMQMLTNLASEKIEELSQQYLGRTITLDEFKEKMMNEILPAAVASYRAAKEAKVRAEEILDILRDGSLDAKQQLQAVFGVLAEYDDVLLAIGLPAEKVESLKTQLHAFKERLLAYVKTTIHTFIDRLTSQLQVAYDLNDLINAYGTNPTFAEYQTELVNALNALGYDGDVAYYAAINQLNALVDNLTYTNAFATLGSAMEIALSFMQIDSLNTVLPAILAKFINAYYNENVKPMSDYLSTNDFVTIEAAKDTFIYAILRTNSAVKAIDYAQRAKGAILTALLDTSFGNTVTQIKEKYDENDIATAHDLLLDLDQAIANSLMSGINGVAILGQIEQRYVASYTSRFTVIFYTLYRDAVRYPQFATYSDDRLFDEVVQPRVTAELAAVMADAGTIAKIQLEVASVIEPTIKSLVNRVFSDLYNIADIHTALGA